MCSRVIRAINKCRNHSDFEKDFLKVQLIVVCSCWDELSFSLKLIWTHTLNILSHISSKQTCFTHSANYTILHAVLIRICIIQGWLFITKADKDSWVQDQMRTSLLSVRSSGCNEASEISKVKNTISFSLIKKYELCRLLQGETGHEASWE